MIDSVNSETNKVGEHVHRRAGRTARFRAESKSFRAAPMFAAASPTSMKPDELPDPRNSDSN